MPGGSNPAGPVKDRAHLGGGWGVGLGKLGPPLGFLSASANFWGRRAGGGIEERLRSATVEPAMVAELMVARRNGCAAQSRAAQWLRCSRLRCAIVEERNDQRQATT